MKKTLTILIVLIFSLGLFVSPTIVSAQECEPVEWLEQAANLPEGRIIPCACTDGGPGDCGLNEVLQTIVNVTQVILAVTGAAAILMFSVGGVMFIIAAGNQEQIQKGKDAIKASSIGIIIVLTAWLLVNFIIGSLTNGDINNVELFDRFWAAGPTAQDSINPLEQTNPEFEPGPGAL